MSRLIFLFLSAANIHRLQKSCQLRYHCQNDAVAFCLSLFSCILCFSFLRSCLHHVWSPSWHCLYIDGTKVIFIVLKSEMSLHIFDKDWKFAIIVLVFSVQQNKYINGKYILNLWCLAFDGFNSIVTSKDISQVCQINKWLELSIGPIRPYSVSKNIRDM